MIDGRLTLQTYEGQRSAIQDLFMKLLNEEIELYKRKVKLVKPKWYQNKWLYFGYGVLGTSTSVWLTGQLVGK